MLREGKKKKKKCKERNVFFYTAEVCFRSFFLSDFFVDCLARGSSASQRKAGPRFKNAIPYVVIILKHLLPGLNLTIVLHLRIVNVLSNRVQIAFRNNHATFRLKSSTQAYRRLDGASARRLTCRRTKLLEFTRGRSFCLTNFYLLLTNNLEWSRLVKYGYTF